MKLANLIFIPLFSFLLAGCYGPRLSVQTQYYNAEDMASYFVHTPDPLQNTPPYGQQLIISWNCYKTYKQYENLFLEIRIRFKNRKEIEFTHCINRPVGDYVYSIFNEDFCKTGGILTYKVVLIADGCVIDEFQHQLWSELIELRDEGTEGTEATEGTEGTEATKGT